MLVFSISTFSTDFPLFVVKGKAGTVPNCATLGDDPKKVGNTGDVPMESL
jgi:hypothetical protein